MHATTIPFNLFVSSQAHAFLPCAPCTVRNDMLQWRGELRQRRQAPVIIINTLESMSSTKHHLNAKPNSLASATDLIGYRWFCVARSVRKAKHSIAPSVASKIKSKRLMTSREHTIYLLRNFLQFSSIICSFVSCVSGGSVDIGLSGVWFLVY